MHVFDFDEECERLLLENSLSVTKVQALRSTMPRVGARLGEALRRNTRVQYLSLVLDAFSGDDDLSLLLQFVEQSASLDQANLFCGGEGERLVILAGLFLQAMSRNSNISTVMLIDCRLPVEDFCSLLSSPRASIEYLQLQGSTFVGAADQQIAMAFKSNETLKGVLIDGVAPELWSPFVLRSLSQHTNLKMLSITGNDSGHLENANLDILGEVLLSSAGHLGIICFRCIEWDGQQPFTPIAAALRQNATSTEIIIQDCKFDSSSCQQLVTIFQSAHMHRTLNVCGESNFDAENGAFLKSLVGSAPGLSKLDLQDFNPSDKNLFVKAVVDALKETTSKVKTVLFGSLTPVQCESLASGLPGFRVLQAMQLELNNESAHLKDMLLRALRGNGSLKKFLITLFERQ